MAANVRAKFSIKQVDGGYKRLLENIYRGEKPKINVGILAKDGAKQHEEGSELTIADIAAIHEYGLGDAQERSFLRAWFDAYQPQIKEAIKRQMQAVVSGKLDKYKALEQLGAWMSGQIQQFMAANMVKPPTSEETNKRKGSSVTLIDQGILRSSISFSIEGVKKPPSPKPLKVTGFSSKKSKAARKKLAKKARRAGGKLRKFASSQSKRVGKLLRSVRKKKKGRGR